MLSASASAGAAAAEASPANIQGGNVSVSAPVGEIVGISGGKAFDLDKGNLLGEMASGASERGQAGTYSTNNTATTYQTQSWTGALETEGHYTYVTTTLAPNQILNATLVCPQSESLNYDLYVYEMDENYTLTNMVSASITKSVWNNYPDGSIKTIDEAAAHVNTSSTTKGYAIIVQATEGGSATDPFTLTLSISAAGTYDNMEPNDSAFYAYPAQTTGNAGNFHVPNDQDWYVMYASQDMASINVTTNSSAKAEVYTVLDGKYLIYVEPNEDGTIPVNTGAHYIKVYPTVASNFTPSSYRLSTSVASQRSGIMDVTNIYGAEGDGVSGFVEYHEGLLFRFGDSISVDVEITLPSGAPLTNHPVTFEWVSGEWASITGNHRRSVTGYTDEDGKVTLTIGGDDMPTAVGGRTYFIPGAIDFTHYYDLDQIFLSSPGIETKSDYVYHFYVSAYN